MRELLSASILISSENAMLSDSRFMDVRMDRRKTHIPDWESRTHRKYRPLIATDKARFPTLCLRLIARRSRTGNRDALRKSTSRWRNASMRYEIASGGYE